MDFLVDIPKNMEYNIINTIPKNMEFKIPLQGERRSNYEIKQGKNFGVPAGASRGGE